MSYILNCEPTRRRENMQRAGEHAGRAQSGSAGLWTTHIQMMWGLRRQPQSRPPTHTSELITSSKGSSSAPRSSEPAGPLFQEKDIIRVEQRGHRADDENAHPATDFEHINDLAHPGQLIMGDPACVYAVCDTYLPRRLSSQRCLRPTRLMPRRNGTSSSGTYLRELLPGCPPEGRQQGDSLGGNRAR